MHIADRFKGCIIGGAIGDAWGSAWESDNQKDDQTTWYWGIKPEPDRSWKLTDDTQLTLATCEILGMHRKIEPAVLAAHFLLPTHHQFCLNFVTSPHGKQGNTRRLLPA